MGGVLHRTHMAIALVNVGLAQRGCTRPALHRQSIKSSTWGINHSLALQHCPGIPVLSPQYRVFKGVFVDFVSSSPQPLLIIVFSLLRPWLA